MVLFYTQVISSLLNPVLHSGEENIHDVISNAIGTLDSHWKGPQPEIGLYGELFERALRCYVERLPISVMKDLLILLRFLEGRVRDPTAPASTKEWATEYRKKFSKMFAASLEGENGWTNSRFYFACVAPQQRAV